jgi:hypothetical protein
MTFSLLLDAEPLDTEADFPVLYTAEELLRRDDAKLTLGNSDANIQRVLEQLLRRHPETSRMSPIKQRAISDVMVGVTIEAQGRGRRSHVSLKRDRYSSRYSLYGYRVMREALEQLHKWGEIYLKKGEWWSFLGKGNESMIWITPDALEWTRDLIGLDDDPNPYPEVIVLTDRETKAHKEYDDTAQTIEMRRQVTRVNDKMTSQVIFNADGSQVTIKPGRRHFLDDFETGGGFYFGAQNIKKEKRRQWQALVNGEKRPMAELDYDAMHPTMLYKMAGLQCVGDPYEIPGYPRPLCKVALNTSWSVKSHQEWVGAVTKALYDSAKLRGSAEYPLTL